MMARLILDERVQRIDVRWEKSPRSAVRLNSADQPAAPEQRLRPNCRQSFQRRKLPDTRSPTNIVALCSLPLPSPLDHNPLPKHEETAPVDQMNLATIYILRKGCTLQHIEPGSGIVGRPDRSGLTLIYYEGNLLDTPALRTHEGRIACAARRLFEDTPTTALIYVDPQAVDESLVAIGSVEWDPDAETCRIAIDPSRGDLLNDYLKQAPAGGA